jgi:predicted NAD/FAD-binding protein
MRESMRIAIIGAGVSGLTVAYLLADRHELTVYEAGRRAGGHSNTVTVETDTGELNLDTGFIVCNDRNYPNFERLLERLGVALQPSEMSFSVSDGRDFEYASTSVNGLYANRRHLFSPSFQRMVSEVPRFQRAARALLRERDERISLLEWLAELGMSSQFVERLIVPQASAVWSADPRQMWSFPALFLAQFFDNHGMLGLRGRPRWRTVAGGSVRYVEALTRDFAPLIRLQTPVKAVQRDADGVTVTAYGEEPERFDHVVIATHSDQAIGLLADPSGPELELLSAIPYQVNEAVLHSDATLLPRRRRAWASWNYHLLDSPRGRTAVTYHLNRLQSLPDAQQYCVTLNLTERIAPERIIRRMEYAHPVYTPAAVSAQRRWQEISGVGRTHFCGAYWGWGFHEDGVSSALRVAESFGASL